jgi:FAD:protein FMN transferase
MGSPLRLQVLAGAPAALVDQAWQAIRVEFEGTEDALSRFRDTSEVHRLRLAGGHATSPSRRLIAALTAADRARRLTSGRFDPRILADLERLGSAPLPVVSADAPRVMPERPLFWRSGRSGPIDVPVGVDFGGIGKGLALRWAARLASEVLDGWPFLLEAGGDIVAHAAPEEHGWRIAIESPVPDVAEPIAVIELPEEGGAIATSSTRRARWAAPDGRSVHHLVDPRTGQPGGDGLLAVTVHAADPAWAEVWSKALFLDGARGIAATARRRGLAAWWVTADRTVEMTPAARVRTVWLEAEAA